MAPTPRRVVLRPKNVDGQAELVFAAAALTQPDDGERHALSRAILIEYTEEVDVIAHL